MLIMKVLNTLCLWAILLLSPMISSAENPLATEPKLIYNHSSFEYRTVDDAGLSLFSNISYNEVVDHLEIQTRELIQFIQLFDQDGELIFQMPVSSSKIHLSINDYDKGNYTLNLKTSKAGSIVSTKLMIK